MMAMAPSAHSDPPQLFCCCCSSPPPTPPPLLLHSDHLQQPLLQIQLQRHPQFQQHRETQTSFLPPFPSANIPLPSTTAFCCRSSSPDAMTSFDLKSEFPFLELKPSRLSAKARGGGSRTANKGRWHAGEAVMRRKFANQAFLIKIGGENGFGGDRKEQAGSGKSGGWGSGGGGGIRRRGGRGVLSQMAEADQFAPSVPYSLNRKHRWARDGADWLAELACGWNSGHRVRLSVSEADYSLAGSKSIRALHSLEMEKGQLRSRWAKSARGALLADLAGKTEEELAEEEEGQENQEPAPEMHFQLARPHSVSKVFAAKFFKRKHFAVRNTKRCTTETVMSSGASRHAAGLVVGQPQQQLPLSAAKSVVAGSCLTSSICAITESEAEEESELMAEYRPRRAETYSLADFLKDSSTPLVIVRRPGAHKNGNSNGGRGGQHTEIELEGSEPDEQQFAIVPELECVPLPLAGDGDDVLGTEAERQRCQPLATLWRQLGASNGSGCLWEFPLPPHIFKSAKELTAQHKTEWRAEMLSGVSGQNDSLLSLDLTQTLLEGQLAGMREADGKLLVLVLSNDRVWVNSLIPFLKSEFPDREQLLSEAIGESAHLEQMISAILNVVCADFAEWHLSRQSQLTSAILPLDHLRSVFHSARLNLSLQPISVQAVLAQQRAEQAGEESQFVNAEELLSLKEGEEEGGDLDEEKEVDEEEEEFELIDMKELLAGGTTKQCQPEQTEQSPPPVPKCAHCLSSSSHLVPLAQLHSCGHQFCRNCLVECTAQQMAHHEAILHCPTCSAQLPLDLLDWLFPLPVANTLVLVHYAERALQKAHKLAQCPGCHSLLDAVEAGRVDSEQMKKQQPPFGQIACSRCQLHWCLHCGKAPHWPLSCAQLAEWTRRMEVSQKPISGQFADICSEARARRVDTRLGWQLGKHMRRLGDLRAERRFGLVRKTALHLLEFGIAWIYLNRQQRPPAWSQLKSQLWTLRDSVECLDNELLFSGSLTDTETLKTRLTNLEQLTEDCVQKFLGA